MRNDPGSTCCAIESTPVGHEGGVEWNASLIYQTLALTSTLHRFLHLPSLATLGAFWGSWGCGIRTRWWRGRRRRSQDPLEILIDFEVGIPGCPWFVANASCSPPVNADTS